MRSTESLLSIFLGEKNARFIEDVLYIFLAGYLIKAQGNKPTGEPRRAQATQEIPGDTRRAPEKPGRRRSPRGPGEPCNELKYVKIIKKKKSNFIAIKMKNSYVQFFKDFMFLN